MRQGFTAVDMLKGFVGLTAAFGFAIAMTALATALPAMIGSPRPPSFQRGDAVEIHPSGTRPDSRGVVIGLVDKSPYSWLRVRVDNGPTAAPRFSETVFHDSELVKVVLPEKP